jgi:hypothetical protein
MSKNTLNIGGKAKAKQTHIGTQIDGASADEAAKLAALGASDENTLNVQPGGELETESLSAGLRLSFGSIEDVGAAIAQVEQHVDAAISAGELTGDDAEDAKREVERAKTEVKNPKPLGERVVKSLKRVSEIFDEVKKQAENAQAIGKVIVKAVPYAAAAFQAAQAFFS